MRTHLGIKRVAKVLEREKSPRVGLYGAGKLGTDCAGYLLGSGMQVCCFFDVNFEKVKTPFNDIPIVSPSRLNHVDISHLVICSEFYANEIRANLATIVEGRNIKVLDFLPDIDLRADCLTESERFEYVDSPKFWEYYQSTTTSKEYAKFVENFIHLLS